MQNCFSSKNGIPAGASGVFGPCSDTTLKNEQ